MLTGLPPCKVLNSVSNSRKFPSFARTRSTSFSIVFTKASFLESVEELEDEDELESSELDELGLLFRRLRFDFFDFFDSFRFLFPILDSINRAAPHTSRK